MKEQHKITKGDSHENELMRWGEFSIKYPNGVTIEKALRCYDKIGGSVILLRDKDENFYLNRQYRDTCNDYMWETPRGRRRDRQESYEDAALRELREETGLQPIELEFLGKLQPDSGWVANTVYVYLAIVEGDITPEPQLDEGIISVHKFSLVQLREMLKTGDITDGYTMAALLLYSLR